MTREDIIRMAREADFGFYDGRDAGGIPRDSLVGMRAITRFANLVEQRAAAAEREACAQVCESLIAPEYATGKVDHNERGWTELCASKIRARGEKP